MRRFNPSLKYVRALAGFSGAELADMLGVTRKTVWGYESGTSQPNEEMKQKLRNILDYDYDEDVMRRSFGAVSCSEERSRISKLYDLASERDRRIVRLILGIGG